MGLSSNGGKLMKGYRARGWTYGKIEDNGKKTTTDLEKRNILSEVFDYLDAHPEMQFGETHRFGNIEFQLDMPETQPILSILVRKRNLVERIEINFSVQK
jgi:hypothetical protein